MFSAGVGDMMEKSGCLVRHRDLGMDGERVLVYGGWG
jgi:hypothetical protein